MQGSKVTHVWVAYCEVSSYYHLACCLPPVTLCPLHEHQLLHSSLWLDSSQQQQLPPGRRISLPSGAAKNLQGQQIKSTHNRGHSNTQPVVQGQTPIAHFPAPSELDHKFHLAEPTRNCWLAVALGSRPI